MIKVLIVDDVMILCQGLKAILQQDTEICVVGMSHNGKEAFEQCKELQPDVVLMDMRMPEFDGAYAIKEIKEAYSHIKILVLTTFDDEETIEKAIFSGADGYILKEMEDGKIIHSIKSVAHGISVLGGTVFQAVKNNWKTPGTYSVELNLTEREREFIHLICQGYSNKEIASMVCLAEGTVKNNLSRILEKLNLKDRTQLAVYAVKNGLD